MLKISLVVSIAILGTIIGVLFVSAQRGQNIGSMPTPAIESGMAKTVPELVAGDWINSEPLSLAGLRGRVVYLEFWTFGCSNCINTLPTVKRFHTNYKDKGLTIIGIETPEFDHEKILENVKNAVGKRGISYPVLTDNEFKNWDAYGVNAWPTIVIIDKMGRERFRHVGEGAYAEQERVIQQLLAE